MELNSPAQASDQFHNKRLVVLVSILTSLCITLVFNLLTYGLPSRADVYTVPVATTDDTISTPPLIASANVIDYKPLDDYYVIEIMGTGFTPATQTLMYGLDLFPETEYVSESLIRAKVPNAVSPVPPDQLIPSETTDDLGQSVTAYLPLSVQAQDNGLLSNMMTAALAVDRNKPAPEITNNVGRNEAFEVPIADDGPLVTKIVIEGQNFHEKSVVMLNYNMKFEKDSVYISYPLDVKFNSTDKTLEVTIDDIFRKYPTSSTFSLKVYNVDPQTGKLINYSNTAKLKITNKNNKKITTPTPSLEDLEFGKEGLKAGKITTGFFKVKNAVFNSRITIDDKIVHPVLVKVTASNEIKFTTGDKMPNGYQRSYILKPGEYKFGIINIDLSGNRVAGNSIMKSALNSSPTVTGLNPNTSRLAVKIKRIVIKGTGFNGISKVRLVAPNQTERIVSVSKSFINSLDLKNDTTLVLSSQELIHKGTYKISVINDGGGVSGEQEYKVSEN